LIKPKGDIFEYVKPKVELEGIVVRVEDVDEDFRVELMQDLTEEIYIIIIDPELYN